MAKDNKPVRQLAYMKVNGITAKSEVIKSPHKEIIDEALLKVAEYDGFYPGEDEIQKELRLEIEGPKLGEVFELSQYFRKLYPDEISEDDMPWEIVFKMYNKVYNRMNGETAETPTVEETVVEQEPTDNKVKEEVDEPSDKETKIIKEEREVVEMADEKRVKEMEDAMKSTLDSLSEEISGGLGGDVTGGSMPQTADAYTKEAVQNSVRDSTNDRIAFSQNAIIEKVVLSTPSAEDRLFNKENPEGTIKNPAKVLETIRKNFGIEEDPDTGSPIFKNIVMTQENQKAALKMYEIVKAAAAGTNEPIKAHVGKNTGTLKGVFFRDPDKNASYKTVADIKDVIVRKAIKLLTAFAGCEFQIDTVKRNAGKSSAGTGTSKSANKSKDSYKGVAALKIASRAAAFADKNFVEYHKEMDDTKHAPAPGFKSDLAVKFKKEDAASGKVKELTYRIPLEVDQYKCEVVDEAKRAVFGDGKGIGGSVVAIDLDNKEALSKALASISSIISDAVTKGVSGFDEIKASASAASNAAAAKDSADLAGELA